MDITKRSPAEMLSIALGSTDPDEQIAALRALRDRLDLAEQEVAFGCRLRGETWADLGRRWGITRQAAQQRFAGSAGLLDRLAEAVGEPSKP